MNKIKKLLNKLSNKFKIKLGASFIGLVFAISIMLNGYAFDNDFYQESDENILSLEDIQVEYSYESFYPTHKEVKEAVRDSQKEKVECEYEVSADSIADIIIANSNQEENSLFKYRLEDESSNLDPQYIDDPIGCRYAFEQAMIYALKFPGNQKENLHTFSEYKIVYDKLKTGILATCNSLTKTITVDINKFINENFNKLNHNKLILVLVHELYHTTQDECSCQKTSSDILDYFKFSGILNFTVESSAESVIANNFSGLITYFIGSYPELREQECILLLMAAFKNNGDLNDYYAAISDENMALLYNLFGLKSEEDHFNFYRICYGLDALVGKNNLGMRHAPWEIGYASYIELYKIVIEDLAKEYQNGNISLVFIKGIWPIIRIMLINDNNVNNLDFNYAMQLIDIRFIDFLAAKENVASDVLLEYFKDIDIEVAINDFEIAYYFPECDANLMLFWEDLKKYPILNTINNNFNLRKHYDIIKNQGRIRSLFF